MRLWEDARAVLERGLASRAFPACAVEVGHATAPIWREALGRLTFDPAAPAARDDTIFDLASLTKVLATTTLMMPLVERGVIGLDDPVAHHLPRWRGADRDRVSVRDLLSHCSGLPAYRPFFETLVGRDAFETLVGRDAFERAICETPLAYSPRSAAVYSDLGFILLGFVLDEGSSLADRFETLRAQIDPSAELQFGPPPTWSARIAPTEPDQGRGRPPVGAVHDENASALGGVAGHAGLFGTVSAVGAFARHYLQILDDRVGLVRRGTLETFITKRGDIPGSSRALGWDTMLATSSCGTRMSPRAFGHVGFTGTSLWIDPVAGVYVALLTNRVYATSTGDAIARVRREFHDAVMATLR